jgi:hypothetical protein
MSSDSLITWKQEPAKPAETWADRIGHDNEEETHAYNLAAAEAEKARLEAEAGARLDNLSDSELVEQWQKAAAAEEAKTLPARQVDAVMRFVQATPELVLNPKNQQRIDMYLKAKKYDATDPSHFDEAYRALSAKNLLDIDESKRQREPWRRPYSVEELEDMPLEQVKKLAEGR